MNKINAVKKYKIKVLTFRFNSVFTSMFFLLHCQKTGGLCILNTLNPTTDVKMYVKTPDDIKLSILISLCRFKSNVKCALSKNVKAVLYILYAKLAQ